MTILPRAKGVEEMIVLEGLASLGQMPRAAAVSIGNFDGIHRGHQALLSMAAGLRSRAPGGVAVVTFEPHPLTVLRPQEAPARLTPPGVKRAILEAAGVDTLVLLPPRPDVLDLTAEQFWKHIVEEMRPAHLVEGNSFFFGKGRAGSVQKMVDWSAGTGIHVHVADAASVVLLNLSIVRVSSSLVRWLISNGRMRDAAICLGRPYLLEGEVVSGFQRGRTIGVPTANLKTEQLVPGDGVYAGRSRVGGRTYPAAVSIGTLPTFDDGGRQIEAHLIGFSGDLYGQTLQVEVTDWLREQRRFANVSELKHQIGRDLEVVAGRINDDPSREIGQAIFETSIRRI